MVSLGVLEMREIDLQAEVMKLRQRLRVVGTIVGVHPDKPNVGLRTRRPDEALHVDVTVIRLLDGTKA